MLKLYIMDCFQYGSIVVISDSLEHARELMLNQINYDPKRGISEHEIKEGFLFVNCGDL